MLEGAALQQSLRSLEYHPQPCFDVQDRECAVETRSSYVALPRPTSHHRLLELRRQADLADSDGSQNAWDKGP